MKKATLTWMMAIALIIGTSAGSQTVAPPYEVADWPGFRSAAVSFTFDDGSPNQFAKALPVFYEFDFKMTLFTVTGTNFGWPPNWTRLQAAAAQGHEIASHTVTHATFAGMADSLQTMELKNSRDAIEARIPGPKCVTLAYPFCAAARKSICSQYYLAARICSNSVEPRTPRDFMNISSIVCGELGQVKTTQHFIDRTASAVKPKGWCVFLIHGIDNDGGYSPLSSTVLRETLEYLNAHRSDYWVSSFGNVARYIRERDAVSVTESSVQADTLVVQVTDTLDNAVFNHPLTLRRPLPEGWPCAAVRQNGGRVDAQIVEIDTLRYIQFDAVPDSGDVLLVKSSSVGVQDHPGAMAPMPALSHNYPNPFNPVTTLHFELGKAEQVVLTVYDNRGREVKTLLNERLPAGAHSAVFNAGGLASGVYFFGLRTPEFSRYRKALLLR